MKFVQVYESLITILLSRKNSCKTFSTVSIILVIYQGTTSEFLLSLNSTFNFLGFRQYSSFLRFQTHFSNLCKSSQDHHWVLYSQSLEQKSQEQLKISAKSCHRASGLSQSSFSAGWFVIKPIYSSIQEFGGITRWFL
jgi:hypothetical protein